jgi:hypothetical protein
MAINQKCCYKTFILAEIWHQILKDIHVRCTAKSSLFMVYHFSWYTTFHFSWYTTFHGISLFMVYHFSWYTTFHGISLFMVYHFSWYITFHGISLFMVYHFSWYITFHGIPLFMDSIKSWIIIQWIFVTIYVLIIYSRGSTGLCIHENTVFPPTTKIAIHEFIWIHSLI